MYNINEFSKLIGVSKQTLRNWDTSDKLVPIKLASGHRRYDESHLLLVKGIKHERLSVVYARESTQNQRASLDNQIEKIKSFCLAGGISVDKIITDTGSALNYKRKGLLELLELIYADRVGTVVIFYKDRLFRFGFEMFSHLCEIKNIKLVVIDSSETEKSKEQEFADDLISIVHHFSMKLYGSRSYKKRVQTATDNLEQIKNELAVN